MAEMPLVAILRGLQPEHAAEIGQILVDAGLTNMRSYPITEKNFRKLISNQKELEYLAQFKTTFNP